ncbi:ribosome-binding factor A [Candidatus Peregrinibacteria bacterium]|nr:MAG: ribosome-binding factor A [Candidatus Peregrinibacteria bacterium]
MTTRTEQIASVIQRGLARHLLPYEQEYGIVTIMRVVVMEDLSEARIFVDATRSGRRLVETLNRRVGVFARELRGIMTQKRTPKLIFRLDEGTVASRRIDELLEE